MSVVISITGGSGSGKTTLSGRIASHFGPAVVLDQDGYYRDLSYIPHLDVGRYNFDHPDAVELDLLAQHVQKLKSGFAIDKPVYDFATHSRRGNKRVHPAKLIIVEGLFVLSDKRLRDLADWKIFVEEADDIRFIRRLQRDIAKRGCSVQTVVDLYLNFVRPMYLKYVLPSRKFADSTISGSVTEKNDEWVKLSSAIAGMMSKDLGK